MSNAYRTCAYAALRSPGRAPSSSDHRSRVGVCRRYRAVFRHTRGARHLEDPIRSFVPDGKFYITTTLGGFGLRFSLAIKMAVVMCTPMIIWQILAFFLPALRPNERKWVVPTVLASTVLFFLGAIFCYFIIIPAGFEWLIGETSAVATALPDLENYVNMELLFMIGFGVAFELPLIIFYLSVFHIVSYAAFRGAWRYVYVGLLVGSAVITPDGSPVTLGLMYGALLSLYDFACHRPCGHYRARGQGEACS
ncbi:MAG: twin-arginine translocase subunit TatC [Collinsella sp.]